MPAMTTRILLVLVGMTVAMTPAVAGAAVPGGVARYVPCPVPTDDPALYAGPNAPFRGHSAIADPNGLVVILREGRAASAGPGPFGRQHAAVDRGVDEEVIARVVSNVVPAVGEQRRLRYVAEAREGEVVVVGRPRAVAAGAGHPAVRGDHGVLQGRGRRGAREVPDHVVRGQLAVAPAEVLRAVRKTASRCSIRRVPPVPCWNASPRHPRARARGGRDRPNANPEANWRRSWRSWPRAWAVAVARGSRSDVPAIARPERLRGERWT
jgi:hypothetical protein